MEKDIRVWLIWHCHPQIEGWNQKMHINSHLLSIKDNTTSNQWVSIRSCGFNFTYPNWVISWFPDSPNLTRSPPRFPIPSMKSPICVVVCVVVTVVTLKKSWHFGLMVGLGEFSPTYKACKILAIRLWSRNSEKAELKWNCSSAFYIRLSDSPSFLDHSKFIGRVSAMTFWTHVSRLYNWYNHLVYTVLICIKKQWPKWLHGLQRLPRILLLRPFFPNHDAFNGAGAWVVNRQVHTEPSYHMLREVKKRNKANRQESGATTTTNTDRYCMNQPKLALSSFRKQKTFARPMLDTFLIHFCNRRPMTNTLRTTN